MTIRGLYVPVDGAAEIKEFRDTDNLTQLQGLVDGLIEGIGGPGWYAYGNDEAKLLEMGVNHRATRMAGIAGWPGKGYDVLAGPIVFFGPGDGEGGDSSVPEALVDLAVMLGILPD